MSVPLADTSMLFPIVPDLYGEWQRDAPWKASGPFMVTTYSRVAVDGKHQTAQARLRRDVIGSIFAEVTLTRSLRAADYHERAGVRRPKWRRRR